MASESSFDVVSEFDRQEMVNAIDQTRREVQTRYDLKDTKTDIELSDKEITITTESEMHLTAIRDIMQSKALRRNLSIKIFKFNPPIEVAGGRIKQVITLQQGLSDEVAKKIQRLIKDQFPKVEAFWSFTMYQDFNLVVNDINRWAIRENMKGLQFDADGGLRIYIQSERPSEDKVGNWLPSPKQGNFNLTMRNYMPSPDIVAQRYDPPVLKRLA